MGETLATFVAHLAIVAAALGLFGYVVIDGINNGDWRRGR